MAALEGGRSEAQVLASPLQRDLFSNPLTTLVSLSVLHPGYKGSVTISFIMCMCGVEGGHSHFSSLITIMLTYHMNEN